MCINMQLYLNKRNKKRESEKERENDMSPLGRPMLPLQLPLFPPCGPAPPASRSVAQQRAAPPPPDQRSSPWPVPPHPGSLGHPGLAAPRSHPLARALARAGAPPVPVGGSHPPNHRPLVHLSPYFPMTRVAATAPTISHRTAPSQPA
jgi:hypothetical protein